MKQDSLLNPQVVNYPAYAPPGYLVFRREQGSTGVWAVRFDLSRREIRGAPFLVAQGGLYPSVSETGTLSYAPTEEGRPVQMTWLDRSGKVLGSVGEPLTGASHLALSPDGRKAAVALSAGGNRDIWIIDLEDGSRTRLTFTPQDEDEPVWSPDGRWIAYSCAAGESTGGICRRAADGSGEREVLSTSGNRPVFEPDGKALVYTTRGSSRRGVMRLELGEGHEPEMIHETTPWGAWALAVSPDGRYLAYGGDEGGQIGVRIAPIDGKEGKWEVGSGDLEGWPASGRELFYRDEAELISVPAQTDPALVLGRRERLFTYESSLSSLSISSDGKRFLVLQPAGKAPAPSGIVVIQNWESEFRGDPR